MGNETGQHSLSRDLARIFDTPISARVVAAMSMKKSSIWHLYSTALGLTAPWTVEIVIYHLFSFSLYIYWI
jgi:hypothetical protein